jgi:hypothetical protein
MIAIKCEQLDERLPRERGAVHATQPVCLLKEGVKRPFDGRRYLHVSGHLEMFLIYQSFAACCVSHWSPGVQAHFLNPVTAQPMKA